MSKTRSRATGSKPEADTAAPVSPPTPSEKRHGRRWRATTIVVLLLLGCAVQAALTARATAPLGPHFATYQLTLSGQLVVDLGPLGTAVRPAPGPPPIGLSVVVHEIPAEFGAFEESASPDNLLADLESYVAFFAGPQETQRMVATAMINAIGKKMLINAAAVAVIFGLGWIVVGRVRGRTLGRVALAAAPWVAVASLVAAAGVTVVAVRDARALRELPGAAVLENSPLAGTRVTGRLGSVLEVYGGRLVRQYRSNEQFYADIAAALGDEWDKAIAAGPDTLPSRVPGATDDLVGPDMTSGPQAEGMRTAQSLELGDSDDWVTIVVVADIHCNFSMSPVIGTLAAKAGADLVLHAGDATIDGTAVEQMCPDSLMNALPADTELVFAGGNHDSEVTANQFAQAGATVLRGKTVEVAGMRILGDLDAYATRMGQGTTLARDETAEELTERLTATACEDEPDLLLFHSPDEGAPVLESGCVPYLISGHWHRRVGPIKLGSGVEYVNASSAGAVSGQPTVGPLHGTAEMTVIRFDPATRAFVDYRIVSAHIDGSVTVGQLVGYPVPQVLDPTVADPTADDAANSNSVG